MPLTVWVTKNCGKILKEFGIPDHLTCPLRNLHAGQEPYYLIYMQSTSHKINQAVWITTWDQDCWEKYQQFQIWRWQHPYGRKWRRTKVSLDESERGAWKSWLKTQYSKNKDRGIGPIISRRRDEGKVETVTDFIFLGSKISTVCDCSHEIKRCLLLEIKAMTNPDSKLKSRITLLKCMYSQSYGFSSSHVQVWELTIKKTKWAPKDWCFRTVVLEKTLESPLDCKELQPVNPKGNQSWIFIGSTDAEAEAPKVWPLYVNSQLIGKDPDARKDWGQEEKGVKEDEMVVWPHQLNKDEFE